MSDTHQPLLFFSAQPYDEQFFKHINEAQNFGFDLKFLNAPLNEQTASLAKGYESICVFVNDTVNATVIEQLYEGGTRLVALRCAGFNNVDLKAARDKLHIVRVPAYSPHAIAEYALGLMLTVNRGFCRAYNRTRGANFSLNGLLGFDMHGKTVGIVGTGKIARVLIKLLQGFEMHLLAYDIYPDESFAKQYNVQYTDLQTLYRQSDIITLHCPLTKDNVHMIDRKAVDEMKKGVILINTGRGALIDAKALIYGLKKRIIGAAALDVYENESSYFYRDHSDDVMEDGVLARLMTFPNVFVSSHQAFFTKEALTNIATTTLENVQAYFNREPLVNEVKEQA
jgi:D-lactate dehydrogenase